MRFAFIHSVGESTALLNDEQRKTITDLVNVDGTESNKNLN